MNNSYDLHSWSKQYRQERLTEARVRPLVERTRGRAETHAGRRSGHSYWRAPLVLLRAVAPWK